MQYCAYSNAVLVWLGSHSNIWLLGLIGRKTKFWPLCFVVLAVSLAQSLASATGGIIFAWSASTDPGVAGYYIYCGGTSGTYTNKVFAGNATNATISGLSRGTTYYFAATAYFTSGMESSFSSEVSCRIPADVPKAVPILTCSNTYTAVVTTNAAEFLNNGLNQVSPTPSFSTNYVFAGFWVYCSTSGVRTLQSSSNLLTWVDYSTGTNAVFIRNTGGNRFFRLKPPYVVPMLNYSNTYTAVVTTNAAGFFTNGLNQVSPIQRFSTNYIFAGFWIYCSTSGVWTLQSSSNLLTWVDYSTGTNAVFIRNTGGNRFFRLKPPYVAPTLNYSNTYTAVVTTNAPGFFSTNYIFAGIWIFYPGSEGWTLQSSSNLLTWFDYSTGTNAVFIRNTGGNRYFRLRSP